MQQAGSSPPRSAQSRSTAPLRVLLYSATSRSQKGGVQSVLQRLRHGLAERGHDVRQGWAHGRGSGSPSGDGAALELPLRLRDPRSGLLGPAKSLAQLYGRLRAVQPDIVNVHFITGQALYFALIKPLLGYKLVFSAHGSDLLRPGLGVAKLLPTLLGRADLVTVVSTDLARTAERIGRMRRLVVIPNGVDLAFWSAAGPSAPPPPSAGRMLLSVGRLEAVKGHDLLLRAAQLLRPEFPDLRVQLIGEGQVRERLHALAGALGLGGVLDMPGARGPEDVRSALHAAHAFVLPSRSEGLPLALLEAMAAGAPIVASAVGGVPDALDGAGLLVPPQDPPALAAALRRLLREPAVAARLAARARARALRYDADCAVDAFEDAFCSLVHRARGAHAEAAAAMGR